MAPLPSSPAGSRFQGGPRKPSANRGPHRCIRLVSCPSPLVSVSTSVCTFLQRVLTSETVTRWVEMEKSVRMVSERSLRDRRGHDHVGTDTPTRSGCKGAAGARKGRERLGQGGRWGTELPKERHPGLGNEAKELQLLRLASATEGRGLHLPCATPGSHHFQFLNSEQTPRPLQWAVTPVPSGALSTRGAITGPPLRGLTRTPKPDPLPAKQEVWGPVWGVHSFLA